MQSIDELKAALTNIFASIPKSMLRNHVSGMCGRLQKVVERDGGHRGMLEIVSDVILFCTVMPSIFGCVFARMDMSSHIKHAH